jgi:hypothetical protein
MARTFSQNGGELTLQKDNLLAAWRLDSVLKDVKLLKVETWWKKARDGNIWGGSSRKSRSIKDCRARGRRRKGMCKCCQHSI